MASFASPRIHMKSHSSGNTFLGNDGEYQHIPSRRGDVTMFETILSKIRHGPSSIFVGKNPKRKRKSKKAEIINSSPKKKHSILEHPEQEKNSIEDRENVREAQP